MVSSDGGWGDGGVAVSKWWFADMIIAACKHALHVGILTLKNWEFPPKTPHLEIIPNFFSLLSFFFH